MSFNIFRKESSNENLSESQMDYLKSKMVNPIADPVNIKLLSHLTRKQREKFSLYSKTVTLYFGEEVAELINIEETSAMRSMPKGYTPEKLIGLNIGCGGRTISPFLLPVDIMRENTFGQSQGEHGALTNSAFLALSDDLPFKSETVDYIVALHMLEHIEDPVSTINHWLDTLKPGGGIGLVLPDWRYTWDSRNDRAPFSHKWNPTPSLMRQLYEKHWSGKSYLETCDTYDFAMSFDVVLRKHGEFKPFCGPDPEKILSGYERHQQGIFLHGD